MKNQLFVLFTIAVIFSALPQVFSENATTIINNNTVPANSSVTQVAELAKPVEQEVQTQNITQSAPEVNNTVPEKSVVAQPVAVSENKTETTPKTEQPSTQNQTTEVTPKTPVVATPVEDSGNQTTKNATEIVATPESAKIETKAPTSMMTVLGRVIFGFATLSFVIFVGCIYNYRYQIKKYKVAPFTPPSFCPSCLFPKVSSGSGSSGYGSIEIGDYNPPRYLEF